MIIKRWKFIWILKIIINLIKFILHLFFIILFKIFLDNFWEGHFKESQNFKVDCKILATNLHKLKWF